MSDPRPSANRASVVTPRERAVTSGTPTMEVHPSLPNRVADHGRLATMATTTAASGAAASTSAARGDVPDTTVPTPSARPMPTSTTVNAGAKASVTAARRAN